MSQIDGVVDHRTMDDRGDLSNRIRQVFEFIWRCLGLWKTLKMQAASREGGGGPQRSPQDHGGPQGYFKPQVATM